MATLFVMWFLKPNRTDCLLNNHGCCMVFILLNKDRKVKKGMKSISDVTCEICFYLNMIWASMINPKTRITLDNIYMRPANSRVLGCPERQLQYCQIFHGSLIFQLGIWLIQLWNIANSIRLYSLICWNDKSKYMNSNMQCIAIGRLTKLTIYHHLLISNDNKTNNLSECNPIWHYVVQSIVLSN